MANLSEHDKEWLFNGFLLMIKRPDVFPQQREYAEQWLASTDNTADLRLYKGRITQILYWEVLPEVVHDILKEYHDDFVETLSEAGLLEEYRTKQSPRNLLAVLA